MSIFVNVPENLKHAEVLVAHQGLLQLFHLLHALDLFFEDSDDSVFDVVAELGEAVVECVGVLPLCDQIVLAGIVAERADHLLEAVLWG